MEYSLSESLEDYLLDIFVLNKEKGVVRIKDIAQKRGVKLPSAINAIKVLSDKYLVNHEKYSYVALTEAGLEEAKRIFDRRKTIYTFLHEVLGINRDIAEKDAHKMEHDLDKNTIELLTKFVEFIRISSKENNINWFKQFEFFERTGLNPEKEGKEKRKMEKVLSKLKVGESGKILRIKGGIGSLKTKLLDMGVISGTVVKVEKVAPLGDPIDILILGYHLSLRKEEAENIIIEEML